MEPLEETQYYVCHVFAHKNNTIAIDISRDVYIKLWIISFFFKHVISELSMLPSSYFDFL